MSFKNENQRSKSVGHPLPSSIVAVAIVLVVNAGFSMRDHRFTAEKDQHASAFFFKPSLTRETTAKHTFDYPLLDSGQPE